MSCNYFRPVFCEVWYTALLRWRAQSTRTLKGKQNGGGCFSSWVADRRLGSPTRIKTVVRCLRRSSAASCTAGCPLDREEEGIWFGSPRATTSFWGCKYVQFCRRVLARIWRRFAFWSCGFVSFVCALASRRYETWHVTRVLYHRWYTKLTLFLGKSFQEARDSLSTNIEFRANWKF